MEASSLSASRALAEPGGGSGGGRRSGSVNPNLRIKIDRQLIRAQVEVTWRVNIDLQTLDRTADGCRRHLQTTARLPHLTARPQNE